jgi:hypothetical protein
VQGGVVVVALLARSREFGSDFEAVRIRVNIQKTHPLDFHVINIKFEIL